ncbi:hypothetical protein [Streptosporangium sp. V21-05]|uniref:hypothetical protein n=1 Tax=Streptosporangium sp. V21-05 TaxID=3446115 RepID=UPI003F5363AE
MARVEHPSIARLHAGLEDAFARAAGRFRREVRLHARIQGPLSGVERESGRSLAEYAGEATWTRRNGC